MNEVVGMWRLAAWQGLQEAQFVFGVCYDKGHGVPQSCEGGSALVAKDC